MLKHVLVCWIQQEKCIAFSKSLDNFRKPWTNTIILLNRHRILQIYLPVIMLECCMLSFPWGNGLLIIKFMPLILYFVFFLKSNHLNLNQRARDDIIMLNIYKRNHFDQENDQEKKMENHALGSGTTKIYFFHLK